MAKLIYSAIMSLDGFIEDAAGQFDWAMPSDEVHAFANDLDRSTGTHLYGRRMYETMAVWETEPGLAEKSDILADYARVWQAADKVVYSTTLAAPLTARTTIERRFHPVVVAAMKAAATANLGIGGPALASHAFRAGLVDECHLFVAPVTVGAGKRALPADLRLDLGLWEERRFSNGTVYLRYEVKSPVPA